MSRAEGQGFVRDRVTWLAYCSISAYAFYIYALGPVVNFLRTELHLSYTLTSLHSTLWAAGAVGTGLFFAPLTRRFGRRAVFWWSALVTAVGVGVLIVGHRVAVTLPGTTVLAAGCTLLGATSNVVLSDHHREQRDRALVEANVGASAVGVAVPALLGLLAGTAGGWRPGLLLPVLCLACLYALLRGVPMPSPAVSGAARGRLPGGFWSACGLVALAVAIEFCVIFYGPPLLSIRAGLATADAAAALSLFIAGELTGRLAGSWLSRRPGRAELLIGIALGISLAGFLALWLGRWAAAELVALFVTGLGVGNLYPLSLSLALGAGGDLTDRAMARTQVAISAAIAGAPLLLGVLSDRAGVLRAVALEPALIVAAAAVLIAVRAGQRSLAGAVPA
ncbi:MAG TPA: MFS transporter [Candidatus Binatia bacterium]|nr:MFS transporter [Candidatus Binatia bacterium]